MYFAACNLFMIGCLMGGLVVWMMTRKSKPSSQNAYFTEECICPYDPDFRCSKLDELCHDCGFWSKIASMMPDPGDIDEYSACPYDPDYWCGDSDNCLGDCNEPDYDYPNRDDIDEYQRCPYDPNCPRNFTESCESICDLPKMEGNNHNEQKES